MNKLLTKTMEELRFVADTVDYLIKVDIVDNSSYELIKSIIDNLLNKRCYTVDELAKIYCMLYRKEDEMEKVKNILKYL